MIRSQIPASALRLLISVKDPLFGAVGDGTTDDTTAISNAFAYAATIGFGTVFFPPGNYSVSPIVATGSRIDVLALGARLTYNGSNASHNLLTFRGNQITVKGLELNGRVWSALGDTIYPSSMLRFEASSPTTTQVSDILVEGCRINGGITAITPRNVARMIVRDCFIYRPYNNGIGALDGQDSYMLLNNVFRETGIGSPIRIGSTSDVAPVRAVIIEGNLFEGCGVLDPADMEEAIDCTSDAESFVRVAGNIVRGGCGGMELKASVSTVLTNAYSYLAVENNQIDVPIDQFFGIACFWSGVALTPDIANNVVIRNNQLRCSATATNSNSSAIVVQAYTDVEITDNLIDSFFVGVNLSGTGSSDATIRRLHMVDNRMRGVDIGISGGGIVEGGLITGNRIVANHFGIQLTGTLTGLEIRNNPHIEATAGSGNSYAIQVRNCTGVVIEGNYLKSRLECIYDVSGSSTGNKARRNTLESTDEDGARLDSGTWEFGMNTVDKLSTKRGHNSAGTVTAYGNNCGTTAGAEAGAGAVGDIKWMAPPAAGHVFEACSVAGNSGGATWVAA